MGDFDRDTRVESLGAGRYRAEPHPDWMIWGPNGGYVATIALRAAGVGRGTKVLANAYTLAPVPGAIFAVGADPVFIEIDDRWHTDCDDLAAKAAESLPRPRAEPAAAKAAARARSASGVAGESRGAALRADLPAPRSPRRRRASRDQPPRAP